MSTAELYPKRFNLLKLPAWAVAGVAALAIGSFDNNTGAKPTHGESASLPAATATSLDKLTGPPARCQVDKVCYERDEMGKAVRVSFRMIKPFFTQAYGSADPGPDQIRYISDRQKSVNTACTPAGSHDSFFNCPFDNNIYIGQGSAWELYRGLQSGDAGFTALVAHEYAHSLQQAAGVPQHLNTPHKQVPGENQADCVAGAWFDWAKERGIFDSSDIYETSDIIYKLGDPLDTPKAQHAHGYPAQRKIAFIQGMKGGLTSCNSFVPRHPIYPA
jgi:predicted metalloprotease